MPNKVYEIHTDLNEKELNEVGLEVFRLWTEFALGLTDLGIMLRHPTGQYASAIRMHTVSASLIIVDADEKIAPEALWLEEHHVAIDMLDHLKPGHSYPMHRGKGGGKKLSGAPKMWAVSQGRVFSGMARTPARKEDRGASNTSGTGPAWTIPAMPAYSPARILADLMRSKYKQRLI